MATVSLDSLRPLFAFVDPHGGNDQGPARLKKIASQAAIVVVGRDADFYYCLDAWADRCSTDVLTEKIFELNALWKPKTFGGESNGLAGLYVDSMGREAKWRGKTLPLVRVNQPTHIKKPYRIRTVLQPLIGHGRLLFRSDHAGVGKLLEQLLAFPLTPQWDMVDALASAIQLVPPRPATVEQSAEMAAKLRYLRASGVSPEVLAAVAAGKDPTPHAHAR